MKTGLFDKNGKEIRVGDQTKLVLAGGEERIFDVCFKNVERCVRNQKEFLGEYSNVEITGVVFSWNGFDLFPCKNDEGISDVSRMEIISSNKNEELKVKKKELRNFTKFLKENSDYICYGESPDSLAEIIWSGQLDNLLNKYILFSREMEE